MKKQPVKKFKPKLNIDQLRALNYDEKKRAIRNRNSEKWHTIIPDLTEKTDADLICIYIEYEKHN